MTPGRSGGSGKVAGDFVAALHPEKTAFHGFENLRETPARHRLILLLTRAREGPPDLPD